MKTVAAIAGTALMVASFMALLAIFSVCLTVEGICKDLIPAILKYADKPTDGGVVKFDPMPPAALLQQEKFRKQFRQDLEKALDGLHIEIAPVMPGMPEPEPSLPPWLNAKPKTRT